MKTLRLLFAVLVAGVFTGMCIGLLAQTPIKVDTFPREDWSNYWDRVVKESAGNHKPILILFRISWNVEGKSEIPPSITAALTDAEVIREITSKCVLYQIVLDYHSVPRKVLLGDERCPTQSRFTLTQQPALILYWPDTQKAVQFNFPMSPSEFLRELKLTE